MFRPKCHDDGPRQGCQIDDALGFKGFLCIPQHIGQHQTAFGVSVDHLDRVAFHGFHDVTGALGAPIRHILDQPHQPHDIGLGPAQRQGFHHPGHHPCPAHIHRHLFHPARRLDRDAARIKAHALAHQRKRRLARNTAIPTHHHDLRGAFRAHPNPQQQPHPKALQLGLVQHVNLNAKRAQIRQAVREFGGGQHIGRFVDQIACEKNALRQSGGCGVRGLCCGHIAHHQGHSALGLFLGRFVNVKTIGAQQQPQDQVSMAGMAFDQRQDGGCAVKTGHRPTRLARACHIGATRQPHQVQRIGGQPCRIGQFHHLARFYTAPSLARHGTAQSTAC